MRSRHATVETVASPEGAAPVLRGRRLVLVRAGWAALVASSLVLFAAAIPALYARRGAPPESVVAGLARLGIPESVYAAYVTALLAVFGLGCFGVAAVIAWRRPDDPVAMFVSLFLALLGGANHPNLRALADAYPALDPLFGLSWRLLFAALILFVFLFPDGRFAPKWTRSLAGLLILAAFATLFSGGDSLAEPSDALGLVLVIVLLVGTGAQVHRYWRVSTPSQRQQTKWVVFGISSAVVGQSVGVLLGPLLARTGFPTALYGVADLTVVTFAYFLIPLSIGFAILRSHLYDIDLVINRALVYGALAACVVGLYVLVVGGLGTLLQARGDLPVSLLATGLVAVLFAPLHGRLQRGVNRLMYGERDDPYAVLSRLGQRLETTLAPAAVLPTAVRTVAESLKLPYAAVEVERNDAFKTVATAGEPVKDTLRLPLHYGGETVGRLILGRRAGEAEFGPSDRRLLDDLTRQIGAAVHAARLSDEAIRLSADLQRSRERLVTAREEERRRLRRDLHDGLGPQLASLSMKAEAARDLLPEDPARSDALLRDITAQTQEAVADVRRLVYGLRPPALDDLGLTGALKAQAAHGDHGGLRVSVEAPESDGLPPLPAAAEVAAYRIVQEAVTNAARHAGGRNCTVRISPDEGAGVLRLEVTDDGRGIPEDRPAGVGLSSMRERAAELGGSCAVEALPSGGTRVAATLPLAPFGRDDGVAAGKA